MNDKENILKEAEELTYKSVNHPDEPYGKIPKDKLPQSAKLNKIPVTREKFDITLPKSIKIEIAIRVIDDEINTIKKQLDKTYNIQKQKELSYQLTTLYITKEYLLQRW